MIRPVVLVAGAGPRARRPVHAAIDRHGTPDGRLTGGGGALRLFQEAVDAQAPGPWVLLLQVEDRFQKRERHLLVGMRDRPGPLVFEAFKTIAFKGRKKR